RQRKPVITLVIYVLMTHEATVVPMTLSSLVVSRDWQEVSVLECILGGLHIDVEVTPDPERAWNKLSRSKVDALIVDRDLAGTDRFLRRVEEGGHNASTVPLVILSAIR